jgi:hypothetical protein
MQNDVYIEDVKISPPTQEIDLGDGIQAIAGITLARALLFPLLPKMPAIGLPNSGNIVRSLPALAYRLKMTEEMTLYPIPRLETTWDMILAARKSEK